MGHMHADTDADRQQLVYTHALTAAVHIINHTTAEMNEWLSPELSIDWKQGFYSHKVHVGVSGVLCVFA